MQQQNLVLSRANNLSGPGRTSSIRYFLPADKPKLIFKKHHLCCYASTVCAKAEKNWFTSSTVLCISTIPDEENSGGSYCNRRSSRKLQTKYTLIMMISRQSGMKTKWHENVIIWP